MKKTWVQKLVLGAYNSVFPPVEVNVGDVGIFLDRGMYHTDSDDNFSVVADIYYKVKVVRIFQDLVEVEVLNINISSRTNTCIRGLAETRSLKYIRPNMVLWEKKD